MKREGASKQEAGPERGHRQQGSSWGCEKGGIPGISLTVLALEAPAY